MTDRLALAVAGLSFRNPVLLAAGTAAYGRELAGMLDLTVPGGLVTKAVSPEPRHGAPAPRVADFSGGMINAVGLANPGVEQVRKRELPWLAANAPGLRVIVNVVGDTAEDFATVIRRLDDAPGVDGFELNVSCPNVKARGAEFCADERALRDVVAGARAHTTRPMFVKLPPALPDIARMAQVALECGASGITAVNTIPGLVIDVETRRPALGLGAGGVSGPGLRPVGVLATWRIRQVTSAPIIGVGGVETAADAIQYMLAGASLVAIGTAALSAPRAVERIVRDLDSWCARNHVHTISDITGTVQWPA